MDINIINININVYKGQAELSNKSLESFDIYLSYTNTTVKTDGDNR